MPAPAVIPAPIAYIKVVAVKKLVVGFWRFMVKLIKVGFRDLILIAHMFLGIKVKKRGKIVGLNSFYFFFF